MNFTEDYNPRHPVYSIIIPTLIITSVSSNLRQKSVRMHRNTFFRTQSVVPVGEQRLQHSQCVNKSSKQIEFHVVSHILPPPIALHLVVTQHQTTRSAVSQHVNGASAVFPFPVELQDPEVRYTMGTSPVMVNGNGC